MKIIFLTSLDLHHKFIISRVYKKFKNLIIVNDTKKISPSFENNYKVNKLQRDYEKKIWSKKKFIIPEAFKIKDANKRLNIEKIKKLKPNLIVTLGAIKLNKNFINNFKKIHIVNLHGGNPNYYRGLDSHYWSIYHNDFGNLKVCIHYIKDKLDTGKIIQIKNIKLFRDMKLYQLRSKNAEVAEKILSSYLSKFCKKKKINSKENKSGRYYSFMPSSLKKIVDKKFNNFTKKIK